RPPTTLLPYTTLFRSEDKAIANPKLTANQRKAVAQAKNINNSDVDLCEFKGRTVIYYSWGNQQGKEFLAEAAYEGTLASFLRSLDRKSTRLNSSHVSI